LYYKNEEFNNNMKFIYSNQKIIEIFFDLIL